ncbi:YhcH/YjgK/YiaL family protein [Atopobacter phocae]|uniref:YhcH/YjgK/YiaL family protein n=1 Tax=Atopobacter phocae TaxID=136492 RepID=UPI00046FDF3C|nr:YhcH/YjgK/YiaL family protein [Atopobacter phocae]
MELYDLRHVTQVKREAVMRVIDYLKDHNLTDLEKGPHHVTNDFYFNVLEYQTTTPDQRVWESHRAYLDIHVPIKGQERIWHNFIDAVQLGDYVEGDDWQQSEATPMSELVIEPGQILVFDREDVHKTGLVAKESESIKKAVFKVKY